MSIENEATDKFFCDEEHPNYAVFTDSVVLVLDGPFSATAIARFVELRSHLDAELGTSIVTL